MRLKGFLSAIALLMASFTLCHADDYVILRSGEILEGNVMQLSQTELKFSPKTKQILRLSTLGLNSKGKEITIPSDELYMIRYQKRGNVYIMPNGERRSGETAKWDSSADRIYMIDGEEIQAWNLEMKDGNINFQKSKDRKRALSASGSVPMEKVFMILYSDGSRDILNDFASKEAPQESDNQGKEPELEFKVIFHQTKATDTLGGIASQYDVTLEQIKEWNDYPEKYSDKTKLPSGTQVMIYVKNRN